MRKLIFSVLLLLPPGVAFAQQSVEALKSLLNQTTTGRAGFTQVVLDKNGKTLQKASGTMEFARPGRFRWEYNKPYEQTIVGDGSRLWIYDKDLNQVTVRKLDRALGASPAALLAGSNEIEKSYVLKAAGSEGGLDWLEATPRTQDTAFQRIRLGLGKGGLEAMQLHDQFGQTTLIRFSDLQRNVKLAPEAFRFSPPQGADVISE
ncbi:MAG TPA: outer membrane lipoprotein chaperone LolA [Burkholderiales bacterium]|nr:outer membrane lipoprotein chaperone LolA [Burkholderiales bacterium]